MPPRIVTARSIGLEFKSNKTPMGPENSTVGHYSAGRRAKNLKEGIALAKAFHLDHQVRLGAAGIGYHFLITDNGAIICCRSTFFNGAHVLNNNAGRIGVNMPATLLLEGEQGGPVRDRPTKRQARAFNWLLHNAHTDAMPRRHRTDRDLSKLPIFVHTEITLNPTTLAPDPGRTRCPGLFRKMYKRGGLPWVEPSGDTDEPIDDGLVDLDPEEEEEILAEVAEGRSPSSEEDDPETGPDEEERLLGEADDVGELPEEDEEFDEDLSELLTEIEAEERQPTG